MNNYTPNDWIAIMTAAGVLITAVGSAITGILAVLLNRKVNRNDVKATVARSELAGDIQQVKHQTNDITTKLAAASLAQGTAEGRETGRVEGRDEERANPSSV